jgi:predicted DCC family thiol-disulfide oxidoreductase YuxK
MATPRLVYDDDCGFCKYCVRWLLRLGEFEPVGFTELTADQTARLPAEYEQCLHLLTEDAVYSCGEAAEQCLDRCGALGHASAVLARRLPFWARIRERGYRFVADRRAVWGRFRSCSNVE